MASSLDMSLDDVIDKSRGGRGRRGGKSKGKGADSEGKAVKSAKSAETKKPSKVDNKPSEAKLDMSLEDVIVKGKKQGKTKGKGKGKKDRADSWSNEWDEWEEERPRKRVYWGQSKGKGKKSWDAKPWGGKGDSWKGGGKGDRWKGGGKGDSWKGGGRWADDWEESWEEKPWKSSSGSGAGRIRDDSPPPRRQRDPWADELRDSHRNGREETRREERGTKRAREEPASGSGKRVRVVNMPRDLDRRDIKEAFESAAGEVVRCEVKGNEAMITFARSRDALKAVETFDRGELNGKTISVTLQ